MKKILIAAVAISLAGPALAADAAALYGSKCAVCHGKDGAGSPAGKKMGAPDLTKLKDGEAKIAAVIANGKGKMTAFKGKLSPAEIDAVAKYVKAGLK
jgi:cytochrome c6